MSMTGIGSLAPCNKVGFIPIIGAMLLTMLSGATAHGQDPLEPEKDVADTVTDDWGLAITPYIFFASQSTDVGGQQLRQSFNDLASLTNFGLQGRVAARYKRLLLSADGTYANLGTEKAVGRTSLSADIKQWILDMKLNWPVFDSRTPDLSGGVGIWVGAGARYWSNDVFVEITTEPILPSGQPSQDTVATVEAWWDPVLGLAMHFPVTQTVGFSIRTTGGGFGIGSASTFMWDAEFAALFRVSRRFLVSAGYRQFRYTRTDGEGADEIKTKVSVVGPTIGFSVGIL